MECEVGVEIEDAAGDIWGCCEEAVGIGEEVWETVVWREEAMFGESFRWRICIFLSLMGYSYMLNFLYPIKAPSVCLSRLWMIRRLVLHQMQPTSSFLGHIPSNQLLASSTALSSL